MNQLATALKNALGQDTADKIAARSQPVVYADLFPNNRRRTGINPRTNEEFNDSHLQGRFTLPLARLKQVVAECEAHGWKDAQVYADLWFQHDGSGAGPMITGQARNVIPEGKRFVPQAQAPVEAATPETAPDAPSDQPPADATETAPTTDNVSA